MARGSKPGSPKRQRKENEEERVRLLLVDSSRGGKAARGAAIILAKWPSYLAAVVWCIIFILSLITLTGLTIYLLLAANKRVWSEQRFLQLNNEYCLRVTAENRSLVDLGYLDAKVDPVGLSLLDPTNNIFYLQRKDLEKEGACAVESVARLCPDKSIFILSMERKVGELKLEHQLREQYSNVHTIKTSGVKYLKGSPFEGLWGEKKVSMLASMVLTVWQYGGMVLTDNLIMVSRKVLDADGNDCAVDKEMIMCPGQCSAFAYEMIEVTIKELTTTRTDPDPEVVVDNSLKIFCGSPKLVQQGCNGIKRMPASEMCRSFNKSCQFVRIDLLKDKTGMDKFCPTIMKK